LEVSSYSQLLASPTIVALFAAAMDAGRPLPFKYQDRIRQAVAKQDVERLL
jgi:hypothetical protein